MNSTVSALFVMADGPYPSLVEDCWTAERDARLYTGPNPGVYHPPCARWCNFWWTARHKGKGLGDDDGCFASAVENVRRWGGVLEHPAGSRAWGRFGLLPPVRGAWTRSLLRPDEWVTEVDQSQYGHRARKTTWLAAVHPTTLPNLDWRRGKVTAWVSTDRPRAELAARGIGMLSKRETALTPVPFAELLVGIADSVNRRETA